MFAQLRDIPFQTPAGPDGLAVIDLDLWVAGQRGSDQVGEAVAVHVADGHGHAPSAGYAGGSEVGHQRPVSQPRWASTRPGAPPIAKIRDPWSKA